MVDEPSNIAENLARIRERTERAVERAGRRSSEITLVGVSKGCPVESIREAYLAGVLHFGESRVQEWETKAPALEGLGATWHLVGHLQRNKASKAGRLFHSVDSLDSLPLAEKVNYALGDGRRLPVLIEVRMDSSAAKTGCNPTELARLAEGVLLMPHLELRGLMTVPALAADPHEVRPVFRKLREMRDELSRHLDWPLPELSMGMSGDFEIAIEEGATQIRVGTALFGARPLA